MMWGKGISYVYLNYLCNTYYGYIFIKFIPCNPYLNNPHTSIAHKKTYHNSYSSFNPFLVYAHKENLVEWINFRYNT